MELCPHKKFSLERLYPFLVSLSKYIPLDAEQLFNIFSYFDSIKEFLTFTFLNKELFDTFFYEVYKKLNSCAYCSNQKICVKENFLSVRYFNVNHTEKCWIETF